MKKQYAYAALIVVIFLLAVFISNYLKCNITDVDAVNIAKVFYNKMNIKYSLEPLCIKDNTKSVFGSTSKVVIVGRADDYKIITEISCKNNEVIHFSNRALLESVRRKFASKQNGAQDVEWPSFIGKDRAKDLLFTLVGRIGLPHDAEFSDISLDKREGVWTAKWNRKFGGTRYENNYIILSIIAINGELYAFNKSVGSEPNSMEVKVTRTEAIEIANRKFADYFPKDKWTLNKDKFEIVSADLRLVTDTQALSRALGLTAKPRLAWVVVYGAKQGMDRDTVGILIVDKSIIKIDAKNKKIISSEINIVP